jgi:hypothetical protein
VHLVGFTIEISYDARPYERQIVLGVQEVGREAVQFMERTHDRFLWWHLSTSGSKRGGESLGKQSVY